MPSKKTGANGRMVLEHYRRENGSGSRETNEIWTLVGLGGLVQLEYSLDDDNAAKGTSSNTIEPYSIEVDQLINLIKTHGKRLATQIE